VKKFIGEASCTALLVQRNSLREEVPVPMVNVYSILTLCYFVVWIGVVVSRVANPGCLYRIRSFPSRIPDPGSKMHKIPDLDRNKEFKHF
jgi:hypothetical protein